MALKHASRHLCLARIVLNPMLASRMKRFVQLTAQQLTGMSPTALFSMAQCITCIPFANKNKRENNAECVTSLRKWSTPFCWNSHLLLHGKVMSNVKNHHSDLRGFGLARFGPAKVYYILSINSSLLLFVTCQKPVKMHLNYWQISSFLIFITFVTGGYPFIRHNQLRNITADLLKEVCSNVTVEPPLQPLTGEVLSVRTSICGEEASWISVQEVSGEAVSNRHFLI